MPFIFYDTETTGLSAAFDQVVQFAAIVTDDNLNEVERFEARSMLRPHIVPSLEAMEITGIGIETLTDPKLPTAYELAIKLADLFEHWGPAVFIGHNTIGFDEDFLRQLFYQSLLPVYVTNTRGNSRADTLLMIQAFAAVHGDKFEIPVNERGRQVFKLEHLAIANGFGAFRAHDALADVEATVFLAQLMRRIDEALFDRLVSLGCRPNAELKAMAAVGFGLPTRAGGVQRLVHLGGLVTDPGQHARVVSVDLSVPLDAVTEIDFDKAEALAAFKFEGRRVFRKVAVNRQPMLISVENGGAWTVPGAPEALGRMRADNAFLRHLNGFLARTAVVYEASEHVEENIYQGFPSRSDEALLSEFHRANWQDRFPLLSALEDQRYRQLGQRLIAEHCPAALPVSVRDRYSSWVAERRKWQGGVPWTTEPPSSNAPVDADPAP